ncbi:hypothetical protein [Corynebacterium heidelbergense]|uniref:Uncharacterized protein n=1 Tax=Corynebacterium heidelbergense TaxID=2055947 RepID=A0A364VA33_9CORY|nr:hypothetical protein [Corynebacterium heidelbergense]RAV33533.1 hypothetical protein CWC39_07965 [Corynebacterium heidelbergense]WCZ36170.1 hypothetical protein CHEID_03050 [Corynebacterium heidelbergense]WCZ37625.1 hypothetical protein CHEID_10540 [Corynebacterium heidelbergense]
MADYMNALHDLAETLTNRGVPATLDPRDLTVPGAVVSLAEIGPDATMCGDHVATAEVMLVAADNGMPAAMESLFDLFDKVSDLTAGATPATFTWSELPTLPALRLTPIPLED